MSTWLQQKQRSAQAAGEKIRHGWQQVLSFYRAHEGFIVLLSLLLYRMVLDLIYTHVVSPHFAYGGFIMAPTPLRLVISWLGTLAMLYPLWTYTREEHASSMLLLFLHLLYFLPMQTLYAYLGLSHTLYISATVYWVLLFILQQKVPRLTFAPSPRGRTPFGVLAALAVAVVLLFSWKYTGFRVITDLFDVYQWRQAAAALQLPRALRYLWSAVVKILPLLMLYYWEKKRYLLSIMLGVATLLAFSFDGAKAVFFLLVLAVGGYLLYKYMDLSMTTTGALLLGTAGLLEYGLRNSYYIITLFFRRVMFIPVWLSDQYVDFFTTHTPDFWRINIWSLLGLEREYAGNVSLMMGMAYQDKAIFANNGLLGDAFLSFGYLGVLLMPVVLILMFRLVDACTAHRNRRILYPYMAFYAFTLTNATWSTTLLTHGLLVVCALFWLLPPQDIHQTALLEVEHGKLI